MMEKCNKKMPMSMRDVGIIGHTRCDRPVFQNGMCSKHYHAWKKKMTPWGERKEYRPATQEDLDKQRSLKIKTSHSHQIFVCIKGVIYQRTDKAPYKIETDIKPDFNTFCVKVL